MNVSDPFFWLQLLAALVLGLAIGLVHFGTLSSVTEDYLAGRAMRAVAVQILRLAVMGGVLFALVRLGALPLLAGALGIVVARMIVLRRKRGEP